MMMADRGRTRRQVAIIGAGPAGMLLGHLLCLRLGPDTASHVTRGPAFEKSVAPLRSFVAEPMRYARRFLAGDAAPIVPPTGAEGMNLAASDVAMPAEALIDVSEDGSSQGIDYVGLPLDPAHSRHPVRPS